MHYNRDGEESCCMSKIPTTNDPFKILKYISREEEFERNGGGQWVSKNRPWKNKKKYTRKIKHKKNNEIT